MSQRNRMTPAARRDEILRAALNLATTHGYTSVTREQIAAAAGVSPALVSATLGTMVQLRRAVMGAAIANEVLAIIAQGLVAGDTRAMRAPLALRQQAAASIVTA